MTTSTPQPPVDDESAEAPDLAVILATAKTRDDLQTAVRMMHARNKRLQAVRDTLAHELSQARRQILATQAGAR